MSMGLGAAAILAICTLPVLAQAPAGIPGVLAPGVVPELVQEGFTFTEGPVGTADGGFSCRRRTGAHSSPVSHRANAS
jgi:hypothetical protein